MWVYTHDPKECSSLVLAYIGDAVFELYVRMYLVAKGGVKVHNLNQDAANLVRASSQADFLRRLEPVLSEEEKDIARRGRNAKSGTVPKNADLQQYRIATGFEALIGYLFLDKQEERLQYLLEYLFTEENKE
ncbi:MAG: ribonuclease III domain-containing protein [Peptococcia bacterium]